MIGSCLKPSISIFLFSYQEAIELQLEYNQLEQSKNIEELINFYETYSKQWCKMIDSSNEKYSFLMTAKKTNFCFCYCSEIVPSYLFRFSPDYIRIRILSSLTEVLQRARRYDESIELIQFLLSTAVL